MKFLAASALLAMVATRAEAAGPSEAVCRANPDPHFMTWHNDYYDYHGGCDLILIQNPTFSGGSFDLHIRTKAYPGWGGITNAALRIGSDTLEVRDDGDWYFNNVSMALTDTSFLMGIYTLTYVPGIISGSTNAWEVAIGGSQYVRITNWGNPGTISVEVSADQADFSDSVGLCGTWVTAGLIARDGTTDFQVVPPPAPATSPGDAMGIEWYVVTPPEPQLFQDGPPACTGPDSQTGQGDIPNKITEDEAERICLREGVEGPDFKNCVFDLVTTQDTNFLKLAPQYFDYKCVPDRDCYKKGGKCMKREDCKKETHFCIPQLCHAEKVPLWLRALDEVGQEKEKRRELAIVEEEEEIDTNISGNGNVRRAALPLEKASDDGKGDKEVEEQGKHSLSAFRDPCVCAVPRPANSGKCCKWKGPFPYPCANIENLGPGFDIDGRCNAVNQGNSCEWEYNDPTCCEIAMNDANCALPNDEAKEDCKNCMYPDLLAIPAKRDDEN